MYVMFQSMCSTSSAVYQAGCAYTLRAVQQLQQGLYCCPHPHARTRMRHLWAHTVDRPGPRDASSRCTVVVGGRGKAHRVYVFAIGLPMSSFLS